jgi:hypothetical protein
MYLREHFITSTPYIYNIYIYILIYTKLITDAVRIAETRKEYKNLVGASQQKKFLDIYLEARIILKLIYRNKVRCFGRIHRARDRSTGALL